jgi:choline dehydrogenase
MRADVLVVGGGTAGCVLAARLSEASDRHVCLVEAGPDYGPLAEGRWPTEILDPRSLPTTHGWGTGGEDGRPLGGRILGGSSAVNGCMVLAGSPGDYDEWGPGWSYEDFRPYLERVTTTLSTAEWNTDHPTPFQAAFVEAAAAAGLPLLADPSDPASPVGVGPSPRNVVDGMRWNTALAYLEQARGRPNLTVLADTLVDRVLLDGSTATGVVTADGRQLDAGMVILAAGAYFSPAILLRSGIGPEDDLREHGIPVLQSLPVGHRLLDHCGTDVAWELTDAGQKQTAADAAATGLFEAHAVVKAASSSCAPGSWDLQLLPWISPVARGGYSASAIVFHMKPLSSGRVRLRSTDPSDLPVVERGFLSRAEDLAPLLEGIELARRIAEVEPLRDWVAAELSPGSTDPEGYVRDTIRNYFHPAGTCPLGTVVDTHGRVFGTDSLYVADASVMPTIPRANTNLTTAAIAEKLAAELG